jgi:hypothetical protein
LGDDIKGHYSKRTEDHISKGGFYVSSMVDMENRAVSQALVSVSGRTESYITEDNGNSRLEFTANQRDLYRSTIWHGLGHVLASFCDGQRVLG